MSTFAIHKLHLSRYKVDHPLSLIHPFIHSFNHNVFETSRLPYSLLGLLILLAWLQVRDSKVSFTPDAALGMMVHLHKPKKGGSDDSKERVQSMQSYGMQDWTDWKGYIAPEDCLMEHRTSNMYTSKYSSPGKQGHNQTPKHLYLLIHAIF